MRKQQLALIGAASLMAWGCCKSYQPLDITLSPALDAAPMPTVQADVAGIPSDDLQQFQDVDARKWFSGSQNRDSNRRQLLMNQGLVKTFEFSQTNPNPKTLRSDNPVWKVFDERGIRNVLIIADPPMSSSDSSMWHKFIEAMSDTWVNDRVAVTITDRGLYAEKQVTKKN